MTATGRRRLWLAVSVLALFVFPNSLVADDDYAAGKAAWLTGNFESAYTHLLAHRRLSNDRRAEVDFMLGTSACRSSDRQRRIWGYRVLDWMSYAYQLDSKSLKQVEEQRDQCLDAPRVDRALAGMTTHIVAQEGARVAGMNATGKEYSSPDRDVPVSSYSPRRIRDVPTELLRRRLILRGEAARGSENLRRLIGSREAVASERFLITSLGSESAVELEQEADLLESFWDFLEVRFEVPTPQHYITVILVPTAEELNRVAGELHGLDLSPSTIGYSYRDDLAMLVLSPAGGRGTLLHEAFHLAAHMHFGDIPWWLDEGIASLYETSRVTEEEVVGLPNWRGRILKHRGDQRPSIDELVRDREFLLPGNAEDDPPGASREETRALFAATARYFALYLQEIGELGNVYTALRNQDFEGAWNGAGDHALTLVERTLDWDRTEIERRFDAWLSTEVWEHAGTDHGGTPPRDTDPVKVVDRQGLARLIATKGDVSLPAAEAVLEALFGDADSNGVLASELANGHKVEIDGFGTFETRRRAERQGRNPATGESITIEPKVLPTFRADRRLRQFVESGPDSEVAQEPPEK